MVQRDYILRMIEELGAALIALRKAIFGGKAPAGEVEDTLRRAASGAGMDIELARAASAEALPAMVAPTGEVEPARCWVLAEALMTDGVHQLQLGNHEARPLVAGQGGRALRTGRPGWRFSHRVPRGARAYRGDRGAACGHRGNCPTGSGTVDVAVGLEPAAHTDLYTVVYSAPWKGALSWWVRNPPSNCRSGW